MAPKSKAPLPLPTELLDSHAQKTWAQASVMRGLTPPKVSDGLVVQRLFTLTAISSPKGARWPSFQRDRLRQAARRDNRLTKAESVL